MASEALRFDILAKDEFSKAFDKLKNKLPSIKTLALGAAAGVTAVGGSLFAMAKTTATAYDKLGKFSDQTGLSTEFLSKMGVAAEFTDINVNTMNKSLERLQTGIGEAGRGIGMAKDTLADMGIELRDSMGQMKTAESILPELADKFQNMTDATQRTEAAQKLFGQRGIEMIKILKDGSEGLKGYADEAAAMGLVVDKKAAANAAKFNDALFKVQGVLTGLKNEIGEEVIPIITGLAEKFSDFVKNNRDKIIEFGEKVITVTIEITERMAYGVGIMVDAWRGLQMIWETLKIGLNEFAKFYVSAYDFILEKTIALMEAINFRGIFDSQISAARGWSDTMKIGIETLQGSADAARGNLKDLVNEGYATSKIDAFIEKSHAAIEAIRAQGEAEIEVQAEKNEVLRTMQEEQNQFDLETFQNQLDELQSMHDDYYLSEQQKLDKWLNTERTKYEGNQRALTKLSQIYSKKQNEIDIANTNLKKQLAEEEFQARLGALSKIASLGKVFGKEFFEVTKIAAISRATINTYLAATEAFAKGGGIPWGIPLAAASIAYGLAQVKQISSQKFAHGGMTNVPREQTLTVTQGERILSPDQNKDFTDFIQGGGGGSSINIEHIDIMPNATNAEALLYMSASDWDDIVETNIIPSLRRLDKAGIVT